MAWLISSLCFGIEVVGAQTQTAQAPTGLTPPSSSSVQTETFESMYESLKALGLHEAETQALNELDAKIRLGIEARVAAGDQLALIELGLMYDKGLGVQRDKSKAQEYLSAAADQGMLEAQRYLGYSLFTGAMGEEGVSKAKIYLDRAVVQGDALAAYYLGLFYKEMSNSPRDPVKAVAYFKIAADRQFVPAMLTLASMYFLGEDVEQNDKQFFLYLKQAADGGDIDAQLALARVYLQGLLGLQDLSQAQRYFELAANQASPQALYFLGVMSQEGLGEVVDYQKALTYYRRAVEDNNLDAHFRLGWMYYQGLGVNKDYEQARLHWLAVSDATADNTHRTFSPSTKTIFMNYLVDELDQTSTSSDILAHYYLGQLYEQGFGVNRDILKAIEYYHYAASKDYADAQFKLGVLSELKNKIQPNVAVDPYAAIQWVVLACENGSKEACDYYAKMKKPANYNDDVLMMRLGLMYAQGQDIESNKVKARQLLESVSDLYDSRAHLFLGQVYQAGLGAPKNMTKALYHYAIAHNLGNGDAPLFLAKIYANGEGVAKDMTKAKQWAKQSCSQGKQAACEWLNKQ